MPILTDQERLGTTIGDGRYRLDSVLGRGGMGTVFEALHEWTGRRVAVKLLREDVASDFDASQRFLQEARSATAIEHPNVVEVLDMGRHDEWTVYLVFELLRGQSLADRLEAVGRLEPMEAVMILLPVADAVAAAHRLGIVHRDLKPDNIFLEDDGMGYIRPKLLDFGIARPTERQGGAVHTGVIAGTPEYLSPEHAQGFRAGPASDVWSLGIVLFECITGNRPFEGDSVLAVLLAITSESIPSLRGFPDVPGPIADVVEGALVRDPVFRIPDAEGFRNALAAASQVDFVPSRSRSVPPKILYEAGEIALSRAHRVEIRRSTPDLAAMPSSGTPRPAPPSAFATLHDVSQSGMGPLDAESLPVRQRLPVASVLLALLFLGVLVFGYRATHLASARDTDPADTNAEAHSLATDPTPASNSGAQPAPEPEVASAAPSDEGSPDVPARAAMARASASAGPAITATPPEPAERRARTSPAGQRPSIQRGANGSLILD